MFFIQEEKQNNKAQLIGVRVPRYVGMYLKPTDLLVYQNELNENPCLEENSFTEYNLTDIMKRIDDREFVEARTVHHDIVIFPLEFMGPSNEPEFYYLV